MAGKFENIRIALTKPLSAAVNIPIAWPNVKFNPVPGQAHAYVRFSRNQPIAVTMGREGYDVHTGSMTVNLFYPKDKSDQPLLRAADAIEEEFQNYVRGDKLTSEDVSVRITSVGVGSADSDDVWFHAPVTILFESYIRGK